VPRVLLVDDDIAEISAVKRVLARAGHQALLATNASDALGTIGRAPPAAVVIASTCEGGEALRRIAEDAVAGALPILVLGETAEAPPGAAQLARPVDPGQLSERLAAALGGGAPEPHGTPVARIAVDRRSAADALRARAEELRRGAVTSALPAAPRRPAPATPPAPVPAPAAAPAFGLELEGDAPGSGETPVTFGEEPVAAAEDQPAAETPFTFGEEPPSAETAVTFAEPPPDEAFGFGDEAPAAEAAAGYDLDGGAAYQEPPQDGEAAAATCDQPPAGEAPPPEEAPPPDEPPLSEAADAQAQADAALAELEARSAAPTPPPGLDLEQDPGLEALLRRAEEAEARAREEGEARRARQQAAARAEAEEEARRAAEEARRAEKQRRRADEEARRAADAEERARSERAARETADRELQRLRHELDEARRAAEDRARAVVEAARAEDEESRRRSEAEEEQLRAAIQSARAEMEALRKRSGAEEEQLRAAIQSARAEMETLRKRSDEDARRRAEAEREAARLAAEAEEARAALEAEREAVEAEAARRAQQVEAGAARRAEDAERRAREAEERAAEAERAARAAASAAPPPLEVPVYVPPAADPAPDPAQESARRRVAALRERDRGAPPPATAARAAAAPPPAPQAAAPPPPDEPPRAPIRPPPAELRSGTLAELPAPRLLALAARAKAGGRLDVDGAATRSLYLEEGRVVGATSSAPAERVEEVALRLGLVTRDQHRMIAASAAPLATRRAAVLLLERGFLKSAELASLVRRRTEEVVFGIFGEAGARFRWSAAEVPTDESTALERSTLQLAVEGVRRRWLAPEVDAVVGGDATLLAPVASPPSAADLGLAPEDRRVLALADGLRTLDEIVAASPLDALSTRQLLAALVLVGALAVRTFQAGRPAAAASAAIDLARVHDKLEQVRRADYFTVLGVGRLCTPHEVRDAYERLRAEYDPRRFQGMREEGLEERLDEILRVVEDARDVLADDFLRAEYLRGLGE
jgi:CheY-like chemotaxis protein